MNMVKPPGYPDRALQSGKIVVRGDFLDQGCALVPQGVCRAPRSSTGLGKNVQTRSLRRCSRSEAGAGLTVERTALQVGPDLSRSQSEAPYFTTRVAAWVRRAAAIELSLLAPVCLQG